MRSQGFPSITDQVAEVLRGGMLSGRWRGTMPGRDRLAGELNVNHKTVEAAMRRLVSQGLLVPQGSGQRRRIVLPEGETGRKDLRVRILSYARSDWRQPVTVGLLHQLRVAGFSANFALRTLTDLGMDVRRVARFVDKSDADAWIVCGGSLDILKWFSERPDPAIAMFGRGAGLPMAAAMVRKAPALETCLRRLVELGHRRIVMLARQERRMPVPGAFEQTFLDALKSQGLPTGSYNLPDWVGTPAGFRACMGSLFKNTPPTALIFGDSDLFVAAQQYLALRGIVAPRDVSLISTDSIPVYDWCEHPVSHINWDDKPIIKKVVQWVNGVAEGKEDNRQVMFDGEFMEGGTIGRAVSEGDMKL